MIICIVLTASFPLVAVSSSVTAELIPSKKTVYANEIFNLTLTVRISGVSIHKTMELLALPDSSVLKLDPFQELPVERRLEGNTVVEIRRSRCAARIVAHGRLALKPKLRIMAIIRRFPGSILFRDEEVVQPYDIPVAAGDIECLPLPETEKPSSFSGAVGNFSLLVSVNPTNATIGSLVKVMSRVIGTGYLDNVRAPSVSPLRRFKVYEPRLRGSNKAELIFEQDLVPLASEADVVPLVTFNFFNPESGRYQTLTGGPFHLLIAEATNTAVGTPSYRPWPDIVPSGPHQLAPGERPVPARLWAMWAAIAVAMGIILELIRRSLKNDARWRRHAARVICGAVFVAAICCSFLAVRARNIERSLLRAVKTESALYAPVNGSDRLFVLPEGAYVVAVERYQEWIRVLWHGRTGWVPTNAVCDQF